MRTTIKQFFLDIGFPDRKEKDAAYQMMGRARRTLHTMRYDRPEGDDHRRIGNLHWHMQRKGYRIKHIDGYHGVSSARPAPKSMPDMISNGKALERYDFTYPIAMMGVNLERIHGADFDAVFMTLITKDHYAFGNIEKRTEDHTIPIFVMTVDPI